MVVVNSPLLFPLLRPDFFRENWWHVRIEGMDLITQLNCFSMKTYYYVFFGFDHYFNKQLHFWGGYTFFLLFFCGGWRGWFVFKA